MTAKLIQISEVDKVHVGDMFFPRDSRFPQWASSVYYEVVSVDPGLESSAHITVHSENLHADIRVPDEVFHHAERYVEEEPPKPPTPTATGYYEDRDGQIWGVYPDAKVQCVGRDPNKAKESLICHDVLDRLPVSRAPYHRVGLGIQKVES